MYPVSYGAIKDSVYSLEVRESHLSGDLRYQDILMNFPRLIDVNYTKRTIPKGGKHCSLSFWIELVKDTCVHLIFTDCLC